MYASCPDCATQLDQTTGICPACSWDPILSVGPIAHQIEQASLVERYRGTDDDAIWSFASPHQGAPVSRMRLLVLIGLFALATVYGIVLTMLGMV